MWEYLGRHPYIRSVFTSCLLYHLQLVVFSGLVQILIHYHSQSASCALPLNSYAVSVDNSQEMPRSSFLTVELDAANATWLLNDAALLSTKTGELLLLTLVYDGRFQSVYAKDFKGAISALASLRGHLLIAQGPKITLNKWNGTELNGVAFFDVPPLYVVSLNIVKNFILLGDIHKSIYFLSWKEQGSQLNLFAKDFGNLDCFATEFLIDGSSLRLVVADEQKNIQIFFYTPKMSESWKGQKLLSRAKFHVGTHVTKFLWLQMLSNSGTNPGSNKTNRYALLFGTLDGSIGCVAPLDELTFRRLQSLQKKLVDAVAHVAGLNPRAFHQFRSNGKAHRPGPDTIVDCKLLTHYEMLLLEEQLEIENQIGMTRSQIFTNLNDLAIGTSFL